LLAFSVLFLLLKVMILGGGKTLHDFH